jgi:hypothetical protein
VGNVVAPGMAVQRTLVFNKNDKKPSFRKLNQIALGFLLSGYWLMLAGG